MERLDSKSERTRRRVLRAAAEAFRRHGFASVTLKDIAGLADLQPGSLYYHFDSKEAIVAAVLEAGIRRSFEETRRAVDALPEDTGAADRLRTAIAAHLHSLLTESHYAAANLRILGQVPEDVRQRHLVSQREYGAYWKGLLQAAADGGVIRRDANLSLVRMLLFGAMNWSVEWYNESGESPEAIAQQLSATVLEGLLPRLNETSPRRSEDSEEGA